MNTGKETWKWGIVALLLAIFLITANQAYQHIANQEVYDAPDDYLKGDSWDLEHQSGPGAGQPMQMTTDYSNNQTTPTVADNSNLSDSLTSPEQIVLEDNIDWNQSDSEQNTPNPKTATEPKKADNSQQTNMYEIFSVPSTKEAVASSTDKTTKETPVSPNKEQAQEATKLETASSEKVSKAVQEPAKAETPSLENASETVQTEVSTEANSVETPTPIPAQINIEPETASSTAQ